jgi:hypothetical protein
MPCIFVLSFTYDSDKKLVPLQGDEIGRLIAHAVEGGIKERRPWYEPSDNLPTERVINAPTQADFDTLVVEMPAERESVSRKQA